MKILFIFPNIDIGGYKNLGIASLIAVAKKSGHQVKLFDTSFINCEKYQSNEVFTDSKTAGEEVFNFTPVNLEGYDYGKKDVDLDMVFSEVIKVFKPDIVALSIFSQEFALGMYLLNIVKGLSSNIINIVGGVHCYADPDGVINNKNVDLINYKMLNSFEKYCKNEHISKNTNPNLNIDNLINDSPIELN